MKKIACVFSFKMSNWVSCQKIVFNLHKAYELNKDIEIHNFNYSAELETFELFKLSEDIQKLRPDAIVFIDHTPHPGPLLALLVPNMDKVRYIFHVFGDFTLEYNKWDATGKLLQNRNVDFIVASDRQKNLIDKFLFEENFSHVCPFPVDPEEFRYDLQLRPQQRKKWGLKDDDFVLLYSGRISRQKRIHTLIEAFHEFLEKSQNTKAHLHIYGGVDNLGDRFLGKWETQGEYFRKVSKTLRSLPELTQSRVKIFGMVPNKDLRSIYQGADVLVNPSVYNDEDYGMSVAEAQCSGLPVITTDWGGLASFYSPDLPTAVKLIPVKIGKKSKLLSREPLIESFLESCISAKDIDRNSVAKLAHDRFSTLACSKILLGTLEKKPKPFSGFNTFFREVVNDHLYKGNPYLDSKGNISKLYKKIYSSYERNHSSTV